MRHCEYRGRPAYCWENEELRVTVFVEGGHIAEIFHKRSGVNPMWTPPWPTMDHSKYSLATHPEYGNDSESKLLAGIAGHNWCVDLFGPASEAEIAAGYTMHGEASIAVYDENLSAELKLSRLRVKRRIELQGNEIVFEEEVENLLPFDRSIAWQQHVTLGPPFVERGVTRIETPVMRSARMNGEEFEWNDRIFPAAGVSADYHTHLLAAGMVRALNPRLGLQIRYDWNLQDFPWLGIWEENHERTIPPWNGETMTWGIEFGASPFPELRFRRAVRGLMWAAPTAVWLPALSTRKIAYRASLSQIAG